jgi:mono/diheme cytochrome c family protein
MKETLRPAAGLAAAAAILAAVTFAWKAEAGPAQGAKAPADAASLARGRYLAKIAGCNDCHTAGYAQSGGQVPEKDWLTGDALGWQGPWGTTYPANLRLALNRMTEDEWVKTAKAAKYRPPMPWFALHDMSEADLRAFHRFVKSLGPAGAPAPAYVPPGQAAGGPVVTFPAPPAKVGAL